MILFQVNMKQSSPFDKLQTLQEKEENYEIYVLNNLIKFNYDL
jgi:hypothetical protein